METIVVKFGGTSVADDHARACAIRQIKNIRAQGCGVVAVVSAMGRKGAPYATDTLLSLLRPADASSPRTRDLIMSCGETISACVFADCLDAEGVPAMPMNSISAGIDTDGAYNSAEITGMDTSRVKTALEKGFVPVITGFQGVSDNWDITTLGRGGSDTSAVVIGGYLNARGVYIYTDVPGVAEADPRIVPQARFLAEVDTEDMLTLAENGAGVIHPRAVAAGKRFHIPVWVRSTFDDQPGTAIFPLAEKPRGLVGLALMKGLPGETPMAGTPLAGTPLAAVTVIAHPIPVSLAVQASEALPLADVSVEGDLLRALVPEEEAPQAMRTLYAIFH